MILVVVDMQPVFPAARHKKLQARIRQTIRDHNGPVCFLEWGGLKGTYPALLRACRGKQMVRCTKFEDDGGDVVIAACKAEGLGSHKHFMLTGVNTPYCVIATANGILKADPDSKVTLLVRGCRTVHEGADRETTFAAVHVWATAGLYMSRRNRGRRFLQFTSLKAD